MCASLYFYICMFTDIGKLENSICFCFSLLPTAITSCSVIIIAALISFFFHFQYVCHLCACLSCLHFPMEFINVSLVFHILIDFKYIWTF